MAGMKVSLNGLIANAGAACRAGDPTFGRMHAYCLEELRDHIIGLVRGKHTLDEFAERYCIKNTDDEDKKE